MSRLLRNILIVLGMTIVLTSVALGLVLARQEPAVPSTAGKTGFVMVAARPIAAGHRIEKADLSWNEVGSAALPVGAFSKPAHSELNAIGGVALQNLAAGEMIGQQHLVPSAAGESLAGNLNPGWRAVTFTADASQSLAGMIVPNDKVDLFLAVASAAVSVPNPLSFGKSSEVSPGDNSTTITNVRVIAINGAMRSRTDTGATAAANPASGGTVTLEVRPEQVGAVLGAAASGRLGIALRSRFDSAAATLQKEGIKRAVPPLQKGSGQATKATAKSTKDAKPDLTRSVPPGVIIIRGGEKSRAK